MAPQQQQTTAGPVASKTNLKNQVGAAATASQKAGALVKSTESKPAPTTWQDYLEQNQKDIEMVLPTLLRKNGGIDRLMRLCLTTLRRKPDLLTCNKESVLGAIMECAAVGIEPETPLGHAYLVPFKSKKTGGKECTLVISWKGLIDLVYRSGMVETIMAMEVYKQDHFTVRYGINETCDHDPHPGVHPESDITHFYAYARIKGGAYRFVSWSVERVLEHRDRFSESWKNNPEQSPWKTDFIPMGKKTMVRQLFNYLPSSVENVVQQALFADEKSVSDPFRFDYDAGMASARDQDLGDDPNKIS